MASQSKKYSLTFKKLKTKWVVHYFNGQFKKLEYKSGGMKSDLWKTLPKILPLDEHHINIIVEKWNGRVIFEKIEAGTKSDYTLYFNEYYSFFEHTYNITPKITNVEGAALKQIIAYLQKEASTNEEALIIWQQLLGNWNKLDAFYQSQNQLKQINGNLTTILIQIKDGKPSNQARKKADNTADDIRRSFQG